MIQVVNVQTLRWLCAARLACIAIPFKSGLPIPAPLPRLTPRTARHKIRVRFANHVLRLPAAIAAKAAERTPFLRPVLLIALPFK